MTQSPPVIARQDHEQQPRGVFVWIIRHPKTSIALFLMLLLVGFTLIIHHAANTRLQRRIDAIRAKGEPVTIEDINATIPNVPREENRAFVLLERAQQLKQNEQLTGEMSSRLPLYGTARYQPTGVALPQDQLDAIREFLTQNADDIAGIREALAMPHGAYDVQWSSPALLMSLPGLTEFRSVSKMIGMQVFLHTADGDLDAALENLLELLRLGEVLDVQYPVVITALVQNAIDGLATELVERTVNQCELEPLALERLQRAVARIESGPNFRNAFVGERVGFLDIHNWIRSGNAGALPGLTGTANPMFGVWAYVPGLPSFDATKGLDMYTAMIEAIEEPDYHSLNRYDRLQMDVQSLPDYYVTCRTLVPSLYRAVQLWVRGVGMNRAMQAGLAAERFRLERGDWPEGLSDLVPDYLAAVPIDPFDGEPIRYAIIPEGICVWTIGEDMTDDGGNVMRLELPSASKWKTDFGWVILNPELRGRPAEVQDDMPDGSPPPSDF